MSDVRTRESVGSLVCRAVGVEKAYQTGDRLLPVLRGVDLSVQEGEVLAIQGPSGAGKSTFLHILGMLDTPTAGKVVLYDRVVSELSEAERAIYRNQHIGFVFQFYHLLRDLNALENVLLPSMVKFGVLAYFGQRRELRERAAHLLEEVGLKERMRHRPGQLSGGERQRVAIARALMNGPALLLCDEPTGNLDQETGQKILDLLWNLKERMRGTYIIVTHDDRLAQRADRSVSMIDGRITPPKGA